MATLGGTVGSVRSSLDLLLLSLCRVVTFTLFFCGGSLKGEGEGDLLAMVLGFILRGVADGFGRGEKYSLIDITWPYLGVSRFICMSELNK